MLALLLVRMELSQYENAGFVYSELLVRKMTGFAPVGYLTS